MALIESTLPLAFTTLRARCGFSIAAGGSAWDCRAGRDVGWGISTTGVAAHLLRLLGAGYQRARRRTPSLPRSNAARCRRVLLTAARRRTHGQTGALRATAAALPRRWRAAAPARIRLRGGAAAKHLLRWPPPH